MDEAADPPPVSPASDSLVDVVIQEPALVEKSASEGREGGDGACGDIRIGVLDEDSRVSSDLASISDTDEDVLSMYQHITRLKEAEDKYEQKRTPANLSAVDAAQLQVKRVIKGYIEHRLRRLCEQRSILELRSRELRRINDTIQILIILGSSISLSFDTLYKATGLSETQAAPFFEITPMLISLFNGVSLGILRFFNVQHSLDLFTALIQNSAEISSSLKQQLETLSRRGRFNDIDALYTEIEGSLKKCAAFTATFQSTIKLTDTVRLVKKYRKLTKQLDKSRRSTV